MRLRLAAMAAIAALLMLFALKGIGTVLPRAFDPLPLARASASILLAGSLGMLLFFTVLRSWLELGGRRELAAVATVGMAGAGIGALVDLRSLLVSVDLASGTPEATLAAHLGELASSAALLWFFVALRRRAHRAVPGTGLAIAGSSLLVGLTLALFVLQASGVGLSWLVAASYLPVMVLGPVAALALAGLLRFFVLVAVDPAPLAS